MEQAGIQLHSRTEKVMKQAGVGSQIRWAIMLLVLTLAAVLGALLIGRYPLSVGDIWHFILAACGFETMAKERYEMLYNVIVQIRLPRIMAAVLVGAALASSGAAYQSVFRNPLVSPELMGVLAGAGFGAALGILISGHWLVVQLLAFVMGVIAVAVAIGIVNLAGGSSLIMLVLGGVISGTLFTALLAGAKFAADLYNRLPAIEYWLMGNLSLADLPTMCGVAIPMAIGIVTLACFGRAMDALSMGDDEARALGVPVTAVRYGIIGIATLISAITVSLAGMVGWVGLIIPHVARLAIGPSNIKLLPTSACLGAIFLLATDGLSRSLFNVEIPIGILTALFGVPVFLLVVRRARKGWL
jgi:iron complex transport system permease protein